MKYGGLEASSLQSSKLSLAGGGDGDGDGRDGNGDGSDLYST